MGNNFGTWGTPWEQDENTFGNKEKTKITSLSPPPNRKKLNPSSAFSLTA
jgi:hypothetical protein